MYVFLHFLTAILNERIPPFLSTLGKNKSNARLKLYYIRDLLFGYHDQSCGLQRCLNKLISSVLDGNYKNKTLKLKASY